MSTSIGSNIKTIARQSINIPLQLTAVTVEVVSDAADLTSGAIGGIMPTTKSLLKSTGHFVIGAVNSELSEAELLKKTEAMTVNQILSDMETGSGKAGQSTTKAIADFFAE